MAGGLLHLLGIITDQPKLQEHVNVVRIWEQKNTVYDKPWLSKLQWSYDHNVGAMNLYVEYTFTIVVFSKHGVYVKNQDTPPIQPGSLVVDMQQKPHSKHLANCMRPSIHSPLILALHKTKCNHSSQPHYTEKTPVKTSLEQC